MGGIVTRAFRQNAAGHCGDGRSQRYRGRDFFPIQVKAAPNATSLKIVTAHPNTRCVYVRWDGTISNSVEAP